MPIAVLPSLALPGIPVSSDAITGIHAKMMTARTPWFDFKQTLSPAARMWGGVAGFAAFLVLWQCVGMYGSMPRSLMPPPSDVALALWRLCTEKQFLSDIGTSLLRILGSFSLAAAIAVPLGLMMGSFARVAAVVGPLTGAFRYLPATAFLPLFLMWLGTGEGQKIALLVVGVVFFLVTLIADNTQTVRTELIETARTLGANRRQILWTVVLRASLPAYVDTLRQMLAVSWTYLVVAEIVASTDGIGAMMMRAKRFLNVDEVMAGIVVIGLLGVLCDAAFRALHRWAFPWLRHAR
jgi:NitT/TauT family transport system permease protein